MDQSPGEVFKFPEIPGEVSNRAIYRTRGKLYIRLQSDFIKRDLYEFKRWCLVNCSSPLNFKKGYRFLKEYKR